VAVNVTDIGADAYISNVHKWAYNPKSACILHVQPKWQPLITPNVISSESSTTSFVTTFEYTGTRNYNAFLAAEVSLAFRASLGTEEEIMAYNHRIAYQGALRTAALWNTSLLIPNETLVPALACVITPPGANISDIRLKLQEAPYNTWIQPGITDEGVNYIRLSGQVYLEDGDIDLFAQRFLSLMKP